MSMLLYHTAALGDFLCILPALRAWRLTHPLERIILLGKPAFGILAKLCGYVDEVWDAQSAVNAWLFSDKAPLPENARARYSSITTAILFTAQGSPIATRLCAAGVTNIHSHAPFPNRRVAIVSYYLSCFPGVAQRFDYSDPMLCPHPAFERDALKLLDGIDDYIVLHPGSGSEIKNWPIENFVEFSKECECRGFHVVWIYGEAESALPVLSGSHSIRNAPLPVLIHLLKKSRAYIGNDSGISHCAASTGCRCVVLFGPSDEVVWSPVGPHVTIVKARRSCAPCHPSRNRMDGCANPCMRLISVEEVVEAFVKIIGK
jgi:heptosyltransferase-2